MATFLYSPLENREDVPKRLKSMSDLHEFSCLHSTVAVGILGEVVSRSVDSVILFLLTLTSVATVEGLSALVMFDPSLSSKSNSICVLCPMYWSLVQTRNKAPSLSTQVKMTWCPGQAYCPLIRVLFSVTD